MANSMRFLACCCVLLLTACHTHPRARPVHHHFMYKGPPMSNTAVFVSGGGELATRLADQVVADLEQRHVHAENVMDVVRISKDNADLVRQLKEMGFTEVLTIFGRSREDESVAGYYTTGNTSVNGTAYSNSTTNATVYGNSIHGTTNTTTVYGGSVLSSSFSIPLVVHRSSMSLDVQLYTVDSERLWGNGFELSTKGFARGRRLLGGG